MYAATAAADALLSVLLHIIDVFIDCIVCMCVCMRPFECSPHSNSRVGNIADCMQIRFSVPH